MILLVILNIYFLIIKEEKDDGLFDRSNVRDDKSVSNSAEVAERPKGLLSFMETANPNAVAKQQKMIKVKNMKEVGEFDPEEGLSRRER